MNNSQTMSSIRDKSNSKSKYSTEENDSELLNINDLLKYLTIIIPRFNTADYDIIYTIFGRREEEFINLIKNVKYFGKSDSLICYGNNNQVLKIFLDNAINNNLKDINIKKFVINGYFDTNEEILLKEICNCLGFKASGGFSHYKKTLENYFKNDNIKDNIIIVIYFDYIDHLVHKKKQRLLYTLFDLVHLSKNLLLIGFTYNYNLMDYMEKRINSRYSHKTIFISIENYIDVVNAIEKTLEKKIENEKSPNNNINKINNLYEDNIKVYEKCGKLFFSCLINEKNEDFIFYLEKMVKLGMSLEGILNRIKQHILLIKIEIENYKNEKNIENIDKLSLIEIISNLTKKVIEEEKRGIILNMLLKCSKFQLMLFICLVSCISKYKEKIILKTFYNKCKTMLTKYMQKRSKYDIVLIQKFLEELNNCNLISVKNDDRYGKIYQLKLPLSETRKILQSLKEYNKLDSEMIKLCENINW